MGFHSWLAGMGCFRDGGHPNMDTQIPPKMDKHGNSNLDHSHKTMLAHWVAPYRYIIYHHISWYININPYIFCISIDIPSISISSIPSCWGQFWITNFSEQVRLATPLRSSKVMENGTTWPFANMLCMARPISVRRSSSWWRGDGWLRILSSLVFRSSGNWTVGDGKWMNTAHLVRWLTYQELWCSIAMAQVIRGYITYI